MIEGGASTPGVRFVYMSHFLRVESVLGEPGCSSADGLVIIYVGGVDRVGEGRITVVCHRE